MIVSQTQLLIIVLATVIPVSAIVIVSVLLYRRRRSRSRQRHFRFLKRGITPIDDEEIESWKVDRGDEKAQIVETQQTPVIVPNSPPPQHQASNSVGSIRKPPSVIIYQNPHTRMSEELGSPRSLHHKRSLDIPPAQVLARAPNARIGLTDEAVQGDDAFIPPLKRQPSRLAKLPPLPASPKHHRTRSSRSSTLSSHWHGAFHDFQFSTPRESSENLPRTNRSLDIRRHNRKHSQSNQPRLSFDEEVFLGGLSPRPLIRKSEIGRAIG